MYNLNHYIPTVINKNWHIPGTEENVYVYNENQKIIDKKYEKDVFAKRGIYTDKTEKSFSNIETHINDILSLSEGIIRCNIAYVGINYKTKDGEYINLLFYILQH